MNQTNLSTTWKSALSSQGLETWCAVSVLVGLLGILLYMVLFATVAIRKPLRTGSGVLVLHLILIEFVLATFGFFWFIVDTYLVQKGHPAQPSACYYYMFAYWVLLFAGNWCAAFLAINRLIAVGRPHIYKNLTTVSARCVQMVLSWVVSFAASIPIAVGVGGDFSIMPPLGNCGILINRKSVVYAIVSALGTYVPLVLTLVTYIALFSIMRPGCRLNRHTVKPKPKSTTETKTVNTGLQRRVAAAQMLLASTLWFCVCFLPIPLVAAADPMILMRYPLLLLWLRTLLFTAFSTKPVR